MPRLTAISLFLFGLLALGACFANDRVRLTDVTSITLRSGQLTTGRRSSPVPQLKCVGGSAGCGRDEPRTVQCYNRGFDGTDVQWECKAELDNAYQFGQLQVICEGYDYPDDPYILKGSCGLEYELDYTAEGRSGHHGGGDSYYHRNDHHNNRYQSSRSSTSFGEAITLVAFITLAYFLYKTCLRSGPQYQQQQYSDADSSSYTSSSSSATPGQAGRPGFWTGAATGGLLGYLFGSSGNRGYGYGSGWGSSYHRPGYNSWGSRSSGWGSGGGGWGSGSSSSSRSRSSGSRTTSGFAGTGRR